MTYQVTLCSEATHPFVPSNLFSDLLVYLTYQRLCDFECSDIQILNSLTRVSKFTRRRKTEACRENEETEIEGLGRSPLGSNI